MLSFNLLSRLKITIYLFKIFQLSIIYFLIRMFFFFGYGIYCLSDTWPTMLATSLTIVANWREASLRYSAAIILLYYGDCHNTQNIIFVNLVDFGLPPKKKAPLKFTPDEKCPQKSAFENPLHVYGIAQRYLQ